VTSVSHTYFLLGDYDRTLASYPPGGRYYLDAAALAAAGREPEALDLLRGRTSLAPLVDSLRLCLVGDRDGCIATARQALSQRPAVEPELGFYLARHLARAGAERDSLTALSQLVTRGFFCSIALEEDPWLKPLAGLSGYGDVMNAVLRREDEARSVFERADGDRALS
jgi:hypothetical protein